MPLLSPWYKLLLYSRQTTTVYCIVFRQSICRNYRAAAHLVIYMPKHSHISPYLFRLHWLPIRFRINIKIATLTFKCIYGSAPDFLSSLFTIRFSSTFSQQSFNSKRTHVIIFDQVTRLSQLTLLSGQRKLCMETERFQPLYRKYGTTFLVPLHIRIEKNFNIHLRSCSRTIILKQLVTQLTERTFKAWFSLAHKISIRTMAGLTQLSIAALLNPMMNKMADEASAILPLMCSHEVWVKVTQQIAFCLCLCFCRPSLHQSKLRCNHKHKHKKNELVRFSCASVLMLLSTQFSLAYTCAYAYAYTLVKTRPKPF